MASKKLKTNPRPISTPSKMTTDEALASTAWRWDAAAYLYAQTKGGRAMLRHWFKENYMKFVTENYLGNEDWQEWFMRAVTPVEDGYILQFGDIWWRTPATVGKHGSHFDDDCMWLENLLDDYLENFKVIGNEDYALEFIRAVNSRVNGSHPPPKPFMFMAGAVRDYISKLALREVPTIIINGIQIPETAGVIYRRGGTLWDEDNKRQTIHGGEVYGAPVRKGRIGRDPFNDDN